MSIYGVPSRRHFPNSTVHILQISDDPNLAATRLLVLQAAGFKVEHRFSSLARSSGPLRLFQVIVLCQSLDPKIAAELSRRICAEAPEARILRMRDGYPDHVLADLSVAAPVEPRELVKVVQRLAQTPGKSGA
jgi:DNA-binding response OmpR family regulator